MLKKVMIICLALSFVFVGGIAFAADGPKSGHETGPAPNSHDGIPDGSGWFIDPDSSIIIAKDQIRDRLRDGSCQEPFISNGSSMIIAKDQIRDRLRDGSCQEPFISNGSRPVC